MLSVFFEGYTGAMTSEISASPTGPETPETSGLGNRIFSWVIALVAGVITAMIGTVAHQNILAIGPVEIPGGLLLGLLASLALMVGIRLIFVDRVAVFAAALGLVGMIAVFTLPSPGGAVLITNSVISLVWTLGPVLIATLVVAWPRFRRPVAPTALTAPIPVRGPADPA